MSEAMKLVRESLGDDAIIVSSKESSGGLVHITAAVEQLAEPEEKAPAQQFSAGLDEEEIAEMVTDMMLKHRVPAHVSDKLISATLTYADGDPVRTLAKALERTFTFKTLESKKQKPIILVGPPGAGKTLMTAKLAASYVLDGKKTSVITTDIARAGGVEQLQAFLDILSLPLLQAEDPKTLKAVLKDIPEHTRVIIDTGGLNPFDPQEMKGLAQLMAVAEMEPALVLPAAIDAEESAEIAMTFEVLGVHKIIPTRLDFARRLGGVLNAADRASLAFTEGSHTPQVANGIMHMTADKLAAMLMPHSPKKDKVRGGKS